MGSDVDVCRMFDQYLYKVSDRAGLYIDTHARCEDHVVEQGLLVTVLCRTRTHRHEQRGMMTMLSRRRRLEHLQSTFAILGFKWHSRKQKCRFLQISYL